MSYRELILGAGSRRTKDLRLPTALEIIASARNTLKWSERRAGTEFIGPVTLDINPDHNPDIVFNLERIDGEEHNRIPLPSRLGTAAPFATPDNHYDELHAYCVLEHIGKQGDYRKFFAQFSEFWRILRPGGFFFGVVPHWADEWAWADPSHTRIISPGTLVFLSQRAYQEQVGVTAMSDFRFCYKANFAIVMCDSSTSHTLFVLRAIK